MSLTPATSPEEVMAAVLAGPPFGWVTPEQTKWENVREGYRRAFLHTLQATPDEPPAGAYHGRGIVVCAGGEKYFPNAFVLLSLLREKYHCRLPVEVWHLGPDEVTDDMRRILTPLGVSFVDGRELARRVPSRILNGWELKTYAILNSQFREVMLLDADNVPTGDPDWLFFSPQYRQHSAILWPDIGDITPEVLALVGLPPRPEPLKEVESGQLVVDKHACWRELSLAHWLNTHSDFYYHHFHGDKEAFQLAWLACDREYAQPPQCLKDQGVFVQYDFAGRPLFLHRTYCKWVVAPELNKVVSQEIDPWCIDRLRLLRDQWGRGREIAAQMAREAPPPEPPPEEPADPLKLYLSRATDTLGLDFTPVQLDFIAEAAKDAEKADALTLLLLAAAARGKHGQTS